MRLSEEKDVAFEVEVQNQTRWPWKRGCYLALSQQQSNPELKVQFASQKVDFKVMGLDKFKLPFTLKLLNSHDNYKFINTTQEIQLQFFEEKNNTPFGEAFSLKVQISL